MARKAKVMQNQQAYLTPKVADVLKLLAAGTFLASMIVIPGMVVVGGVAVKGIKRYQQYKEEKEWAKYNRSRLKQVIRRLQKQKVVQIRGNAIAITDKGKQKLLRYDLEQVKLRGDTDGRWRLIIYDISDLRRKERELFRRMLKKLKLYQLQKSVYLTPFVCDNEIEYLRQYFGVVDEVQVLKISGLENEAEYKQYFGI